MEAGLESQRQWVASGSESDWARVPVAGWAWVPVAGRRRAWNCHVKQGYAVCSIDINPLKIRIVI